MKIYKLIFLGLIILFICSCTVTKNNGVPADYVLEFNLDYKKAKLHRNAAYLFCDQQGYPKCYGITYEQCISEMSSFKDDCFKKAEQKLTSLNTEKDLHEFSNYFFYCMLMKHLTLHSEKNLKQIDKCINALKLDNEQRDKSLNK